MARKSTHATGIDPWLLVAMGMPDDRARLVAPRVRLGQFRRGALIAPRGAIPEAWCYVESGLVASAVPLIDGWPQPGDGGLAAGDGAAPEPTNRVSQLYGQGAWFGEAALVDPAPAPLQYHALAPSVVGFMPGAEFHAALDGCPYFARYVFNLVSHRAGRMLQLMLAHKHGSPACRVVYTLAHLCEALDESSAWSPTPANSERVVVDCGQTELAHACDVSRALFSSILGALAAAGFAEASYGRLVFLRCAAWRGVARRVREGAVFEAGQSLGGFIDMLRSEGGHA